jgi:hypothetical protein
VLNDVTPTPFAKTEPPVDAAYQFSEHEAAGVAEIVADPPPQGVLPPTASAAAAGKAFTVAKTATLEEATHLVTVLESSA